MSVASANFSELCKDEVIGLIEECIEALAADSWSEAENWTKDEVKLFGLEGDIAKITIMFV